MKLSPLDVWITPFSFSNIVNTLDNSLLVARSVSAEQKTNPESEMTQYDVTCVVPSKYVDVD